MSIRNSYLVSKEYTGTTDLPRIETRLYFAVYATTGSLTVEFGGGGGTILVPEGGFYEPLVPPTSPVQIIGGTYTVAEG